MLVFDTGTDFFCSQLISDHCLIRTQSIYQIHYQSLKLTSFSLEPHRILKHSDRFYNRFQLFLVLLLDCLLQLQNSAQQFLLLR